MTVVVVVALGDNVLGITNGGVLAKGDAKASGIGLGILVVMMVATVSTY